MSGIAKRIIFERKFWLLRHSLFWLIHFIVFTAMTVSEPAGMRQGFKTTLLFMPVNMFYFYVVLYWLVPRYLIPEKYFSFFFLFCAWAFIGMCLHAACRIYVVSPLLLGKRAPSYSFIEAFYLVFSLVSFIVMNTTAMFGIFIEMYKHWTSEVREKIDLQQQKTIAELELLKAQLHPHFLFNTLNNLYSLVLESSDKAPQMLLRLSALLNYVLYECKAPEVSLEKEILVLQDYMQLEQQRYGNRLDISTDFSGDIPGKMVAPMLFLPFVENAFKHGAAEKLGRVWISVEASVKGSQLFFRVINSADWSLTRPATGSGGIGINNVRRRLELLYPDRYLFRQDFEEELYIVSLTIQLGAGPRPQWPVIPLTEMVDS